MNSSVLFIRPQKRIDQAGIAMAGLIWHPAEGQYFDYVKNSFCYFRRVFEIEDMPEKCIIKLYADSRYMLYVNGRYVCRGPCRSDPRWQYYDEVDITAYIKQGKNVIAVLVLFYGYGTGQSISAMQGLWAVVDIRDVKGINLKIVSDENWKCKLSEAYDRSAPRINARQGPMEVFDVRKAPEGWTEAVYDDTAWECAVEVFPKNNGPFWNKLPRSIPMLHEDVIEAAGLIAVGEIIEKPFPDHQLDMQLFEELKSYREVSHKEAPEKGIFSTVQTPCGKACIVTYDFKKIYPGYLQLDLAGKAGDIVDVIYAEELFRGRTILNKLNRPADRFIIKEGGNELEIAFGWKAYRYVQLIIRNPHGGLKIKKVCMRSRRYPVRELGNFVTQDRQLNDIWEICAHTLKICMQDGFVDSPSREQQQWMGDGRWQAVYNYYLSGDPRLHRKLLEQIGQSQDCEGMTRARYPDAHNNIMPIPHFCLAWISSFCDYYLYTGDDSMFSLWWPNILLALRWFTAFENAEGLLSDVPYWMFIDWSEKPLALDVSRGGVITILNLMYSEALEAVVEIAGHLGDHQAESVFLERRAKLNENIRRKLWNEEQGAYVDCFVQGNMSNTVSEAANALAILYLHESADDRVEHILRNVFSKEARNQVVRASPYLLAVVERALIKAGKPEIALEMLRERYGNILSVGATTTWEEWKLFNTYGDGQVAIRSASHGWGASPILFFMEGLFGIKILRPGFKKIRIKPNPCGLEEIQGNIPTPSGILSIHVFKKSGVYRMDVKTPEEIEAVIENDFIC